MTTIPSPFCFGPINRYWIAFSNSGAANDGVYRRLSNTFAIPPAKRPVDRTPICSPDEVARIDPVWVPGPVPRCFWEVPARRRDYLLWLGHKLGFRYMKDWYRLTHDQFKRNYGGGLAKRYWRDSAIEGVKECFPEYDWHDWLFVTALRGFWQDRENHARYMRWLGRQLGYRRPEDWYSVTIEDFRRHKGMAMLLQYHDAPSNAVMAFFPDHPWEEWRFCKAPSGFWQKAENRLRYLRWLGAELGCRRPEDWYAVRGRDFRSHFGGECLKHYRYLPALAAMDLFPDYPWEEWKFEKAPRGFWHQAENRRRYLEWLGRECGFRGMEDWRRVRQADFIGHCGGGLLSLYRSYFDLLRDCWPEVDWGPVGRGDASPAAFVGPRPLGTRRAASTRTSLSIVDASAVPCEAVNRG